MGLVTRMATKCRVDCPITADRPACVLEGNEGNYLLPIKTTTGYAESALTEPWACVIAAYGLEYRTKLKAGGTTWIIGTSSDDARAYSISTGFDAA